MPKNKRMVVVQKKDDNKEDKKRNKQVGAKSEAPMSAKKSRTSSDSGSSVGTPGRPTVMRAVKKGQHVKVSNPYPELLPHGPDDNGALQFEGKEYTVGEETRVLMARQEQMYSVLLQLFKMSRVLKQDHRLIQDHLHLTKFNIDSHKGKRERTQQQQHQEQHNFD